MIIEEEVGRVGAREELLTMLIMIIIAIIEVVGTRVITYIHMVWSIKQELSVCIHFVPII